MRSFRIVFVVMVVMCNLLAARPTHGKPPIYQITDLGDLGGGRSIGNAINDNGSVTGYSMLSNPSRLHAFRYDGTMHDLGSLGGNSCSGWGINSSGTVAGWANTSDNTVHAFIYDTTMHDLGTLIGGGTSFLDINKSGTTTGSNGHAFRYDGTLHDLGSLNGGNSAGNGINDSGTVTGWSDASDGRQHVFIYDTTMHDLGTLGGSYAYGWRINSSGMVVGASELSDYSVHAFRYDGTMHDLGSLDKNSNSLGHGINDMGTVVGQSGTVDGLHAFYYDTAMYDLNGYLDNSGKGWVLESATGINNRGQITGYGINPQGQEHAFLLAPRLVITTHDPTAFDPYMAPIKTPNMPPSIWRYNGWGVNPVALQGRLIQIHASPNQQVRVWIQYDTPNGLTDAHSGGHDHVIHSQYDDNRPWGFLSLTKTASDKLWATLANGQKPFLQSGEDNYYHNFATGITVTGRASDGVALLWYTASEISGTETIYASTTEPLAKDRTVTSLPITLAVSNLAPLVGISLDPVNGIRGLMNVGFEETDHLENWFAAPKLASNLQEATAKYQMDQANDAELKWYLDQLANLGYDFPNDPNNTTAGLPYLPKSPEPIFLNDVSLEQGGLFDVNGDWVSPHTGHRTGTHADIRSIHLYESSPYANPQGGKNGSAQKPIHLPGGEPLGYGWRGSGWQKAKQDNRLNNPKPTQMFGDQGWYYDAHGSRHRYTAASRARMQILIQRVHYRRLELLLMALAYSSNGTMRGAIFVPEPGDPHIHVQYD